MKTLLTFAAAVALSGAAVALGDELPAAVKQVWEKDCAKCHGLSGKADTKAGKMIGAIDFTDPKNQEKFTDEQMFKTIKEGVKDKKGKFTMKPAEKVTDDQIKELVKFVRSFKK